MGSNWAEEFRRQIEESEGKYRPAENPDDADDEEWEGEEEEEEEDVELEEPEDETEEVEQEEEGEEEAEEFEQEAEKAEIEKPLPTSVEMPKVLLEKQRFRQELDNVRMCENSLSVTGLNW